MAAERHPITGCRPDELYTSPWAILPDVHQRLADICVAVDLHKLHAENVSNREAEAKNPPKLYEVNGRTAVITMGGPITKHPTSFQSLIGGSSTVQTEMALRAAYQDNSVDRVLLHLDGVPGGTLNGVDDLLHKMQHGLKPVYVHVSDQATSLGQWIASAGKHVTANRHASLGGIGAYTVMKDTSEASKARGVRVIVISSRDGKGIGVDGAPVTDEQIEKVREGVKKAANLFVTNLAENRKLKFSKVDGIADGRILLAEEAKEFGLIDDICTFDECLERLNAKSSPVLLSRGYGSSGSGSVAAVERSKVMALTPDQVIRARKLPGAATVAEEQLDVKLLEVAETLIRDNETLRTQASSTPKPEAEEFLKGRAELATEKVGILESKGLITSAQANTLRGLIMKDNKPNTAFLTKDPSGETAFSMMCKVFEMNTPNGLAGTTTGSQTAAVTEPGAGDKKKDPQKERDLTRLNETRMNLGLAPVKA